MSFNHLTTNIGFRGEDVPNYLFDKKYIYDYINEQERWKGRRGKRDRQRKRKGNKRIKKEGKIK